MKRLSDSTGPVSYTHLDVYKRQDEYYATRVDVGSVLVPYREQCSESLVEFIFEGDVPGKSSD